MTQLQMCQLQMNQLFLQKKQKLQMWNCKCVNCNTSRSFFQFLFSFPVEETAVLPVFQQTLPPFGKNWNYIKQMCGEARKRRKDNKKEP